MTPEPQLEPTYVSPGYTFFYYGFIVPKRRYSEYTGFLGIGGERLIVPIRLEISGHEYPAKMRVARIKSPKYPNRNVLMVYYENEQDTLKAMRKLFLYSYASTINKTKSNLKELMELSHVKGDLFRVRAISRQKTDFDQMFRFMEDKNLFDYWKSYTKGGKGDSFFIGFSPKWINVKDLPNFNNRNNVIYLLYHSANKQLYVGKANKLGERVKVGEGRIGLANDWDRFMFFEINPEYNSFIEQIEAFVIRTFASLLENDVGMTPLNERNIKLVNRQLITQARKATRKMTKNIVEQATLLDDSGLIMT